MAKFPSQRKLLYQTGALSNDTYTILTSGGVSGDLNLPKDLSILNRRGYASTTRKGVPLVYQCKIDFYLHDEDGQGPSTAMGSDLQATLKIDGCQNNWVMRNAAVKFHAAREEMFKKAGVRKVDRGAYSHEIRYNYDANADVWLMPIDGDGNAFTGGTWDVTRLVTDDDTNFELKLVGQAATEDSDFSASAQQLGFSYLTSRANLDDDTNEESNIALRSVLGDMLAKGGMDVASQDDIRNVAETAQDNVPYDVFTNDGINDDITEPVELGRAIAGFGNAYGSCIVEIPFGLAGMKATVYDAADTAVNPSGLVCVEVLDIFEMQG
jgi:hypothetical protein